MLTYVFVSSKQPAHLDFHLLQQHGFTYYLMVFINSWRKKKH